MRQALLLNVYEYRPSGDDQIPSQIINHIVNHVHPDIRSAAEAVMAVRFYDPRHRPVIGKQLGDLLEGRVNLERHARSSFGWPWAFHVSFQPVTVV